MKNPYSKHFSKKSILKYLGFTVLFIAISVLSITYILHQFNNISFSDIHVFKTKALIQLAILLIAFILIDSSRLYFILKALQESIPLPYIIILVLINFFVCNVTPFTIGGAFAMIYFLNKEGLSVGKAAAVTSLKAFLASSFNMMLVPIALFIVQKGIQKDESVQEVSIYFPIILIGYVLFIILLFKLLKHKDKINTITYRFFKALYHRKLISSNTFYKVYEGTSKQIENFSYNFRMFFGGRPKYIILTFISTVLYYGILYTFSVIMFKDLELGIPAIEIMANQAVATFIMYFGVTPGGSGFAEGGYLYLFSKLVTNETHLAALTFYWRLFTVYITSTIGGILFFIEVVKIYKRRKKIKSS